MSSVVPFPSLPPLPVDGPASDARLSERSARPARMTKAALSREQLARAPVLVEEISPSSILMAPSAVSAQSVIAQAASSATHRGARPAAEVLSPVDALIQLLDYVGKAESSGGKSSFHLPTPGALTLWQSDLLDLPGVELNTRPPGRDPSSEPVWLRVSRLQEEPAPLPHDQIAPWAQIDPSPHVEPSLLPSFEVDGNVHEFHALDQLDRDVIDDLFSQYKVMWSAWSRREQRRRLTMALYVRLFALRQSLETEGASSPMDLVWGVGMATWRINAKHVVRYPLLTKLVEISLDPDTMALEICPRDAVGRLELDAYSEAGCVGISGVAMSARMLMADQNFEVSPFEPAIVEPVLRCVVSLLDPKGKHLAAEPLDAAGAPVAGDANLQVTNSWAIFTRTRQSSHLLEDLDRLKGSLESYKQAGNLEAIPAGPLALVTPPATQRKVAQKVRFRGVSQVVSARSVGVGASLLGMPQAQPETLQELYFPKPYNDEQVSVVERLAHSDGVVVQGPPGTGKTHTIANVISHYLALGKRVLVTSKSEPALAVLRNHIPEGIRDLTVSLLTSERDGMKQFEGAISRISDQLTRIDPESLAAEIDTIMLRVDEIHENLGAVDAEIERWASLHMTAVDFLGAKEMPEALARFVTTKAPQHAWFPDAIAWEAPQDSIETIDESVVHQARIARSRLGTHLADMVAPHIPTSALPDSASVLALHANLIRLRQATLLLNSKRAPALADSSERTIERAEALSEALARGIQHLRTDWMAALWAQNLRKIWRRRLVDETCDRDVKMIEDLMHAIERLAKQRQAFGAQPIKIPTLTAKTYPLFTQAVESLSEGKNPFTLLAFAMRAAKPLAMAVTVSGETPATSQQWQHVLNYLLHVREVRKAGARWNALAAEFGMPKLDNLEDLKTLAELRNKALAIRRLVHSFDDVITGLAVGVLENPRDDGKVEEIAPQIVEMDVSNLEKLRGMIAGRLEEVRLSAMTSQASGLSMLVEQAAAPLREAAEAFLRDVLGQSTVADSEVPRRWSEVLSVASQMSDLHAAYRALQSLAQAFAQAGAAEWSRRLLAQGFDSAQDPLLPPDWREALHWSRAREYVKKIDGREALRALQDRRVQGERELAKAYSQLIESRTWLGVYENATPAVRSALNAYMNAIRMIGKGTGVRAVRYRREARSAMERAYLAVPCWIMPHWRVSESLPAEIGSFDLVVLDEASQSDLWALPSILRGKKIMVVGDDRQVSPDGIGLDEERVQELSDNFLAQQVFGSEMTPEKSIYDLARVVFADSHVMLREHFRCVQPIIDFSNQEFYNGEVRPLRLPRDGERLDPPLVDIFVREGTRDPGSKINRPEARAIVDEIKSVCADPALAGKSIGVVSLLGSDQSALIDQMVREEIDARDIVARNIECGDARNFQGKERDIMMLSMVVTPGRVQSATRREFQQRFNVAASRARDRMMLFRSVALSDLNPEDLRAKLITHFSAFASQAVDERESGKDTAALRKRAQTDFERSVFDALVARGYKVTPQVQIGAYHIDLVIEGTGAQSDRRLAVECDADRIQSADRWHADMKRQRVLERAGWTFWRCFAATWTLRPKHCMQELCDALSKAGIAPVRNAPVETSLPIAWLPSSAPHLDTSAGQDLRRPQG